ncbi:Rieske 2Fe-2S domain-containing protein [Candidatus Poribacteria bacterium]|nr:Rieske 2Fe-2S domain-containing protein [Candidatus Poribacteria bacterium]
MKIEKIVAKTTDLENGEMKEFLVGEVEVLLVRDNNNFYALGSTCPHFGAPLEEGVLHQHHIRCPWHQACFDVVTGDLKEPPSLDSLARFDVRIEDDNVIVIVEEDASETRHPDMAKYNPDADKQTFIIVGTGAAGATAAEAMRQGGFEGKILMLTKESRLPYDRTGLSKGFLKSEDQEPEMLRSEEFYSEYGIEVLTGHNVTGVDAHSKKLMLDNGKYLKYDKVLLAPGSIPREVDVPGAGLDNVITLRNPDNSLKIRSLAQKGAKLVIIGASFIGMEISANLAEKGLYITIVAPEELPYQRILGAEVGSMYKEIHENSGTVFKLGRKVARFEGNKSVEKVVLDNGETLESDFVVTGVGVRPATDFLKNMELNPDRSVTVDKHFQVTEDIYAAGDIVSFIDWRSGERIRIEHWRLAEQLGRVAGFNMAGKETEYRSIPFFWTNQLGVNLRYVGYAKDWDEIIFHGKPSMRNFVAYYIKNDKVMAASGAGKIAHMPAIAELMRTDQMPEPDELRQGIVNMTKRLN